MAKYQTIYAHLRQAILRGEYAPDGQLPSENALAIRFGVSRITTKRALNELAKADLVYRIQGKGSFVKPHGSVRSRRLLLVLPFANPKLGDYASGIRAGLRGTTWQLETLTTPQFTRLDLSALDCAGVFYYLRDVNKEMPTLIQAACLHLPLVVLNDIPSRLALPSVTSDNATGGALAVGYLQTHHHERIAFCSRIPFWQDWTGTVAQRFFGYVNHYQAPTPEAPLRWAQALGQCSDVQHIAAYLQHEQITALIMGNDIEAVNLSTSLQQLGWQLPHDLAMVGFDNLDIAAANQPALTTLTQDFPEIGRRAVTLLLAQINNPQHSDSTHLTVPVRLIPRASTQTNLST